MYMCIGANPGVGGGRLPAHSHSQHVKLPTAKEEADALVLSGMSCQDMSSSVIETIRKWEPSLNDKGGAGDGGRIEWSAECRRL